MKLIIGLGNPGQKYDQTRHNAGFLALDFLATQEGLTFHEEKKAKAETASFFFNEEKILLAKPQTFMNASGESVAFLASFYNIPPEDIFVIYDDVDLEFGIIRLRKDGSAGGHNGIKSIIHHLGSETFRRFRIGVSQAPDPRPLEDWVLSKFTKEELEELFPLFKTLQEKLFSVIEQQAFQEETIHVTP